MALSVIGGGYDSLKPRLSPPAVRCSLSPPLKGRRLSFVSCPWHFGTWHWRVSRRTSTGRWDPFL